MPTCMTAKGGGDRCITSPGPNLEAQGRQRGDGKARARMLIRLIPGSIPWAACGRDGTHGGGGVCESVEHSRINTKGGKAARGWR